MTFNLIMISAEMEHGGNLVHRHFDGHPNCFTYPFESQLGTKYSNNILCPAVHPIRYGYTAFPEGTSYDRAFTLIWDEELKAYIRNPTRSKFGSCGLIMDEQKRRESFSSYWQKLHWDSWEKCYHPISRRTVVEAYFRSCFDAWENFIRSGKETHYVGYNPGMVAETDKIFSDFPSAHIIHVVRNPFSAYGDYLKRPYPQQTLEEYCLPYNIAHQLAYNYSKKYPNNSHLLKLEDFLKSKKDALLPILEKIGIPWEDTFNYPSFNGKKLDKLPPWGTVETPTFAYNLEMAFKHKNDIKDKIFNECRLLIEKFNYEPYYK